MRAACSTGSKKPRKAAANKGTDSEFSVFRRLFCAIDYQNLDRCATGFKFQPKLEHDFRPNRHCIRTDIERSDIQNLCRNVDQSLEVCFVDDEAAFLPLKDIDEVR